MSLVGGGSPAGRPIRVLVGKAGLDGHDRGAKVVARALRDAGMEVVYSGLHRTPAQIVAAAVQEDVEVIGISILSGAHLAVFPALLAAMDEAGCADMLVVAGGVIPDEDVPRLQEFGVAAVIDQETPLDEVVTRVKELVAAHRDVSGEEVFR